MTHSKNVSGYSDRASSGPNRLSGSLLANLFARLASKWISQSQAAALERAIPAYRLACNNERVFKKRGNTRGIGRARRQKQTALHQALRVR